ncbi:phage holin family protein [Anaeropeptidivorans aminofermentans]|uniref:phage holin family protein n=1 Tax=Anaeropeptidivorans aminofermentans TaxID=2934315 RepID=UPI0020243AFC|nr:phage holin family protein [Anaeropeptidivorans aminofermentans]MBE6011716.1 phage holin family protein [Lachnospiraceae bacterium]
MKEMEFKIIVGWIMAFFSYYLGGFDMALKSLVMAMVIDYITGLLRAGYHKELNSKIGFKGIIKKLMYFALVAFGTWLDNVVGAGGILRETLIFFFIANEGLSILENYGSCGFPMPEFLKEKLMQLKDGRK